MGCPPDPYEKSMMSSADEVRSLSSSYVRLHAEARQTLPVLAEVRRLTGAEALDEPGRVLAGFPPSPRTRVDVSWRDLSDESLGRANTTVAALEQETKALEVALCVARDALLRASGNALPEALQGPLAVERERHIAHRRNDVSTRLAVLRRDLALVRVQQPASDGERQAGSVEMKRLQQELQRLMALTDEALLQSREL